jgi:hypothetical protein
MGSFVYTVFVTQNLVTFFRGGYPSSFNSSRKGPLAGRSRGPKKNVAGLRGSRGPKKKLLGSEGPEIRKKFFGVLGWVREKIF